MLLLYPALAPRGYPTIRPTVVVALFQPIPEPLGYLLCLVTGEPGCHGQSLLKRIVPVIVIVTYQVSVKLSLSLLKKYWSSNLPNGLVIAVAVSCPRTSQLSDYTAYRCSSSFPADSGAFWVSPLLGTWRARFPWAVVT